MCFLLGQAVLASVWIGLALLGRLTPLIVWSVLIPAAAYAALARTFVTQPHSLLLSGAGESGVGIGIRIVAVLVVLLAMLFGLAALFGPPDGDAVAFYLTIGKVIAASQRLVPMPGDYAQFTSVGLITELHYAALMSIGDPAAARCFPWLAALAGGGLLVQSATCLGVGVSGRWLALAMLATSSAYTNHMSDGKVDAVAAALGIAAMAAVLRVKHPGDRVAIALAGLLTGFATVAKFSYLPTLVPAIGLIVLFRVDSESDTGSRRFSAAVRSATWFAIWMLIAWMPHLLKNAALFGQPLVPFVPTAEVARWTEQSWFSPGETRALLAIYPLALVFGNYPMQIGNLSPLLLAYFPLLIFLRPERLNDRLAIQITLAATLGLVLWVAFRPAIMAPRYIFANLIFLALPLSLVIERATVGKERRPLVGFAVIAAAIFLLMITMTKTRGLSHAIGLTTGEATECVSEENDHLCETSIRLNKHAAVGARVWWVAYYGYRLRPDLLQCRNTQGDSKRLGTLNGGELWWALHRLGFDYVVIDKWTHASELSRFSLAKIPAGLHAKILENSGRVLVIHLQAAGVSGEREAECSQASPPAWDITGRAAHAASLLK